MNTAPPLSASADDFFSNEPVVTEPVTTSPSAPAAPAPAAPASTPSTPPPAAPATPQTAAPATGDAPADDAEAGWGEWEDEPGAAAPAPAAPATPPVTEPAPAASDLFAQVAAELGLTDVPKSPQELTTAVRQYAEAMAQPNSPLAALDARLALTGREFVAAEVRDRAQMLGLYSQARIDNYLNEIEASDDLENAEAAFRQERQGQRNRVFTEQQDAIAEQNRQKAEAAATYQRTIQTMKDPTGKDLPLRVRQEIERYIFSGEYEKEILTNPQLHVERALEQHPQLGKNFRELRNRQLRLQGQTSFIKEELEGKTIQAPGMGAPAPHRPYASTAEEFFSDN